MGTFIIMVKEDILGSRAAGGLQLAESFQWGDGGRLNVPVLSVFIYALFKFVFVFAKLC